MTSEWGLALFGGALIGLAVTLMLLLNGRVTGISGILYGVISSGHKGDRAWRWTFLGGLFAGGLVLNITHFWSPSELDFSVDTMKLIVAGGLVGFGTVLGSGCTSGHGVCGISRLSFRSLVATLIFIAAGITAVSLFKESL